MKDERCIWIVDDDMSVREIMQVILAEEGYMVRTYASEKELMRGLDQGSPCLLFLDILLSGADGREIALKLKSDPKYNDIPIIIMSANHRFLDDVNRKMAEDVLTKPFEMDELINKTEKYVQLHARS